MNLSKLIKWNRHLNLSNYHAWLSIESDQHGLLRPTYYFDQHQFNQTKLNWSKTIKQCPQVKSHSSSHATINSSSWISSNFASSLKNWVMSLSLSVSMRASKGQFFWIMTRALRFSVPSLQRRRDVRMPAMKKIRLHSIWLHGMPRNCWATKTTVGKRDSCSFHHNNWQATSTGSTTRCWKRLSSPNTNPLLASAIEVGASKLTHVANRNCLFMSANTLIVRQIKVESLLQTPWRQISLQ